MYSAKDCTNENVYKSQLEGRYLILKEEFFKPEFRLEKYQLVLCVGGIGSDPSKIGNPTNGVTKIVDCNLCSLL